MYMQQLNQWSIKHHPKWLVVLRVILGLSLIIKGIQFLKNTAILEQLITQSTISPNLFWISILIPWLHLLGGSMIVAGLYTRLSSAIQLPILLGAVFFVNAKQSVLSGEQSLLFSIVVLLLLILFLIEGGGPISLDRGLRESKEEI